MSGGALVVCRFCGRESHLVAPVFAQPPQPHPHPQALPPAAPRKSSSPAWVLMVPLAVAALVGFVGLSIGLRWIVRSNATKVESRVLVAAAGPLVYVTHDNRLDALRAASGEVAWSVEK